VSDLFEVKPADTQFYQENIQSFIPDRIIDIHTHVWLAQHRVQVADNLSGIVSWPGRVARENPIEDLINTYHLLFPDKKVMPLIFSNVGPGDDVSAMNDYVRTAAETHHFPSLVFALPEWHAEQFEKTILQGGYYGCKVYFSLAASYIPTQEIRIFDFLPHHQLEVMNRHGWIAMLHIPRNNRLKDPVNLAQILEIEARYPRVKLIIAHVGRAYCPEDVGSALEILSRTRYINFDISANCNETVFRQLIEAIGPKRILFGSDMPILRMRTQRICEASNYVNLVPRGLYGPVSEDKHMREVDGSEADRLTFFMYEEIDAFRRAAEASRLSSADIEDIFHNNAKKLLNAVIKESKREYI